MTRNLVDSPWRTWYIVLRILFDLSDVFAQIHLGQLDDLRPFQYLPPEIQNREDANHGVAKEEVGDLPIPADEDSEAIHQDHDDAATKGIPCEERLVPPLVRKVVSRVTLRFPRFLEASVSESNDGEVD